MKHNDFTQITEVILQTRVIFISQIIDFNQVIKFKKDKAKSLKD